MMSLRICPISLIALLVVVLSGCRSTATPDTAMQYADASGWSHYGFEDRNTGPQVALGAVGGGESNVIVRGTIVEVCSKKGCWMRVTDGDEELFTRFQDYAFFVPMNSASREVVMHGTAVAQVTSVEELRHYAEDAGQSADEIAAITEPQTRVIFFADSVYIAGDGLDEPWSE